MTHAYDVANETHETIVVPADKTMVFISDCPRLKSVVLHDRITRLFVCNCPIEAVNLTGSPIEVIQFVDCAEIKRIQLDRCKNLHCLKYTGAASVTINMCPSLEDLRVNCGQLRVSNCVGLLEIVVCAPELTVVDCPMVSMIRSLGYVKKLDLHRAGPRYYATHMGCAEVLRIESIEVLRIGWVVYRSPDDFRDLLLRKKVIEESVCVVCLDAEPDVVGVMCGHQCVCMACSTRITRCPLCRTWL
jgi:hypothetical protein